LPEHELVCGSEPAWERGEGEATAEQQPPRASGCEATMSSPLPEKHQAPPTWRAKCQSGFVTLPLVLLQEQPSVVLLLEGPLVSWSLAMDECGGR
jgi:hypothetical protein